MLTYTPHFIPNKIILIGGGGTGSRLMNHLPQLVKSCINKYNPNSWIAELPIFIVDGDKVEEKNLARQNFIAKDVGQYKSTVLANRYSSAYGIPIYSCSEFWGKDNTTIPGPRELFNFTGYTNESDYNFDNSVIILAVDSAKARKKLLSTILKQTNQGSKRIFIIDAGNEDNFGQVRWFTSDILYTSPSDVGDKTQIEELLVGCPNSSINQYPVKYIPIDLRYYRDLGESATELSCANLPQTLAINNMMAALICSTLQNFLYLKPMNYHGVRYGLDGGISTEYNTFRSFLKRAVYSGYEGMIDLLPEIPEYGVFFVRESSNYINFHNVIKDGYKKHIQETIDKYRSIGMEVLENGDIIEIPSPPPEIKIEENLKKEIPDLEKVEGIPIHDIVEEYSVVNRDLDFVVPELEVVRPPRADISIAEIEDVAPPRTPPARLPRRRRTIPA
jgi:hypothetical protein